MIRTKKGTEQVKRTAAKPEKSKHPYERENYAVSFQPVAQCGYMDCKFCYSEINILPEKELFTIGLSIYDEAAVAASTKYKQRRRQRKAKLMRLAMQTLALTDTMLQALDASDEGDEEIRADALKKLENEIEEEGEG